MVHAFALSVLLVSTTASGVLLGRLRSSDPVAFDAGGPWSMVERFYGQRSGLVLDSISITAFAVAVVAGLRIFSPGLAVLAAFAVSIVGVICGLMLSPSPESRSN